MMDGRRWVSESGCSLVITGDEDEVIRARTAGIRAAAELIALRAC
jgi:hypothetical protein